MAYERTSGIDFSTIDRSGRPGGNTNYIGVMTIYAEPQIAQIFAYETTEGVFTTSGALRQSGVGSIRIPLKTTAENFKIKVLPPTGDFQGLTVNVQGILNSSKTFILPWNQVIAEAALKEFLANASDNANFNENYVWQGEIDSAGFIVSGKGIWTYKTAFERENAYACKVALLKRSSWGYARVWARRKIGEKLIPSPNTFWKDYLTQLWWFDPWSLFQTHRRILGDKYLTWDVDTNGNNKTLNEYDDILYNEIIKNTNALNYSGIKAGTLPFSHVRTYQRWDSVRNGTEVKAVGKYFGDQTGGVVLLHEFEFFDSRVNPIPYLTDPAEFILKVTEKGVGEVLNFVGEALNIVLEKACNLVQSGLGQTVLQFTGENGQVVSQTADALCGKKAPPPVDSTSNLTLYLALGGAAVLGLFLISSRK